MFWILGLVGVLVLAVFLFVTLSPQFGASPSKAQFASYAKSAQFKDGKFHNIGGVESNIAFGDLFKVIKGYFVPQPHTVPDENISVEKIDSIRIADYVGDTRMFWFGHSTFLLQTQGKNILIDPMFGEVPAPNPMLGTPRFSKNLPIDIDELPKIDAVIFSHDHYDHLDYGSVKRIKDKVDAFYTPLGLGAHLSSWGVPKENITEMDWWDESDFLGMKLICAPAQHFSGRGFGDKGSTLWSSWIFKTGTEAIFFSGDSGYGPHFKEIGEKHGPFDFAMMECGQYNELWKEIHMMPEETAQAGLDVKAERIMPIHWGAFKLAMHPWTEPIERVSKKAQELGLPLITPRIGEPIYVNEKNSGSKNWWTNY